MTLLKQTNMKDGIAIVLRKVDSGFMVAKMSLADGSHSEEMVYPAYDSALLDFGYRSGADDIFVVRTMTAYGKVVGTHTIEAGTRMTFNPGAITCE